MSTLAGGPTGHEDDPYPPPEESASVLADIFRENDVYLGGSAIGKGFRRSARYYLETVAPARLRQLERDAEGDVVGAGNDGGAGVGNALLEPDLEVPPEDSFYVLDLGVVVYQYYQWRRRFPRVRPYYAVKCNPDPVIIRTLATLGSNFDCASRQEIRLVREQTGGLPRMPDIVYANPCKARAHIVEAVRSGVTLMTYDNEAEVRKCASVSKKIRLILRIATDDTGSACRLSTKFGAPRRHWRGLLSAAERCGLDVVGVSFHVGSGCHDATRYDLALRDARDVFDMAKNEFGFENMTILDIGGGFPGETHSLWNPELRDAANEEDEQDDEQDEEDAAEAKKEGSDGDGAAAQPLMFFNEIADHVAPVLDEMFPESSGVHIIAEPGRYLVASSATLLVNVVAVRRNMLDEEDRANPISDEEAAGALAGLTREEEGGIVRGQGDAGRPLFREVMEKVTWRSERFARQSLAQQEVDVYADRVDLAAWINESMRSLDLDDLRGLLPPRTDGASPERAKDVREKHTAEGVPSAIVNECIEDDDAGAAGADRAPGVDGGPGAADLHALAAAGEAAIAGAVLEAVSTSLPAQDDFAYYVNDGVYGAFNNIMFDHAAVRPRLLRNTAAAKKRGQQHKVTASTSGDGFKSLLSFGSDSDEERGGGGVLYLSTIFGPTCDSIDVVARSVLLPRLSIGDWLYFNNMGAYTMAAASSFNGFTPTEKFYVCSVRPEHFERLVAGPDVEGEGGK